MDSITILKAIDGCILAKRYDTPDPDAGVDHSKGFLFDAYTKPVTNLADLAKVLTSLRGRTDLAVIRGELRAGVDPHSVRRKGGQGEPFEAKPRYWVMLDIDKRPDDDGTFKSDPHAAADAVRYELPDPFRGASCFWHASGSAGIKPEVRLHLWFWLDRAVSESEWKAWIKGWSVRIDPGVMQHVQLHYTSDPILGFPDPMSGRSGTLPGHACVKVPTVIAPSSALQQVAEKALNRAVHAIRCSLPGARNTTLFTESCKVAQYAPLLGQRGIDALTLAGEKVDNDVAAVGATIRSAFQSTTPHPACAADGEWARGLQLTDKGTFATSDANVLQVCMQHPALRGMLAIDVRANEPLVLRAPPWDQEELFGPYPRPLRNLDGAKACMWLDREARLPGVGKKTARDSIAEAAQLIEIDVFRDWLGALEHDGIPRLDTWIVRAAASPDNPDYLKAIGSKWLISAAARTFAPGAKVDTAPIFIGAQGTGKSTMLRELAGAAYFSEMQSKIGANDDYMQLSGPVIVELAELASLHKGEVAAIKQHMSTAVDRRRRPYAPLPERIARRCVYAGTTNEPEFLQDTTGNRRFWPVHVRAIDVAWITANREQLWAEAAARYRAKEDWWLTKDEEALAIDMQEDARDVDMLEHHLKRYLETPQKAGAYDALPAEQLDASGLVMWVTAVQVVSAIEQHIKVHAGKNLASAFRALGWTQARTEKQRFYVRGAK